MISRSIIDAFVPLFIRNTEPETIGRGKLAIPKLKKIDLEHLLNSVMILFKQEDTLLNLEGDFNVVGDIHGNLRDLIRIFNYCGSPSSNKFIFLGDYVDRGDMSIEVVVLLFAFKLAYPNNIYLIRGNHEFEIINTYYGFHQQVLSSYDDDMYDLFNEVFSYLPLGAVVNQKYLLVHGGISPYLKSIDQIANIKRPITDFIEGPDANLITDIMWSDPSRIYSLFHPSPRGFGYVYGHDAMNDFLRQNIVKYVVRAHQCVTNGYEENFGGSVITVFSSSNYCTMPANSSSILEIHPEEPHRASVFPPIKHLRKFECDFKIVDCIDTIPLCKKLNPNTKHNSMRNWQMSKRPILSTAFPPKSLRPDDSRLLSPYNSIGEIPKITIIPSPQIKKCISIPSELHLD
ncbi:phosphoprotein phosphatase protein [Trichomonas vaginalis G3]|uniref:phosphoprotein phosphatase protein n=1 Tax=Trichomonas vaginalis (strain ATCC PRA-98 / G3) TaxID=412133 RepID=UPI0021E5BF72|nr:phosphoprotein phosphatase protein [Trichomonas vaginalis G3]KAI5537779.1 phosphoprotein phosphatase protein [Trichomonas vaginalis G3]